MMNHSWQGSVIDLLRAEIQRSTKFQFRFGGLDKKRKFKIHKGKIYSVYFENAFKIVHLAQGAANSHKPKRGSERVQLGTGRTK